MTRLYSTLQLQYDSIPFQVRAVVAMCCRKEEDEYSQAELRRAEEEAKKMRLQVIIMSRE